MVHRPVKATSAILVSMVLLSGVRAGRDVATGGGHHIHPRRRPARVKWLADDGIVLVGWYNVADLLAVHDAFVLLLGEFNEESLASPRLSIIEHDD